MTSSFRQGMRQIILELRDRPEMPANIGHYVDRLAELNWSSDLAALAKIWKYSPETVEKYLDCMVSQLHAFPAVGAAEPHAAVAR